MSFILSHPGKLHFLILQNVEQYIYVYYYLKNFCKTNFIYKFVYDYAEEFNFVIDRGTKSCTIHEGFSNESETLSGVHKVSDSLPTLFWVVGCLQQMAVQAFCWWHLGLDRVAAGCISYIPNKQFVVHYRLHLGIAICIVPHEPIPKWFVDCNSIIFLVVHD